MDAGQEQSSPEKQKIHEVLPPHVFHFGRKPFLLILLIVSLAAFGGTVLVSNKNGTTPIQITPPPPTPIISATKAPAKPSPTSCSGLSDKNCGPGYVCTKDCSGPPIARVTQIPSFHCMAKQEAAKLRACPL